MKNLKNKTEPIYPLFSVISSLFIFIETLTLAKSKIAIFFVFAVIIVFCCFGYLKVLFRMIPFLLIYELITSLIFYFASNKNLTFVYQMAVRFSGVYIALIPTVTLSPVNLVRNLNQLKFPRILTLGMLITISFIPNLVSEIKQIKNAMKTRGATRWYKPSILYRAFIIPLIISLLNISDTLTISVETRGFNPESKNYTNYKTIPITKRDVLFFILIITICISNIILFVLKENIK